MAIAQINWGRLRYTLDHPDMAKLNAALSDVYRQAEQSPGFIWRIPDADASEQLSQLGYDSRMSATVSVWETIEALHRFTFNNDHGAYFKDRAQWFEPVPPPQLVLWDVAPSARPNFHEAFLRLEELKTEGASPSAYGWPKHLNG